MRFLKIVLLLAAGCFISGFVFNALASNKDDAAENFSRLLDYIAQDDLQKPLVMFQDHGDDFDEALNRENLAYLNQNKELLENIKSRLKADTLRWEMAASSKRRLIVPEERAEYADLFQRYCQKSVNFLLSRLQMTSPYSDIVTLHTPPPPVSPADTKGIKAYLVHNVADEYVEEYIFFNLDDDSPKIKIKLSNKVFTGIVGSYTSDLMIGENYRFEFVHEPYTLWQNSAKNPLNVFIVPVEETLHILLRDTTEIAIRTDIDRLHPRKRDELETLVHDWMAVEEAIVGGLVARIMPEIISHFVQDARVEALNQALAERDRHAQYRYLDRGIQIVVDLGPEKAVRLFKSNPMGFKSMVVHSALTAESPMGDMIGEPKSSASQTRSFIR